MPNTQMHDTFRPMVYLPIEDHGIIGDLHTVALVGKNGTIDWYCIPSFDAPSVFGALLDAEKGGFFSIAPQDTPEMALKQYYLPETNVLVTRFLTESGVGEVTDFMPIQQATSPTDRHGIVRAVRVVNGSLSFEMTCRPAFNYARDSHTVEPAERGMVFRSPSLMLGLFSTVPVQADGQGGARASFTLGEDEWAIFVLRSAEAPEVTTPEQVSRNVPEGPGGYQGLLAHLAQAVPLPGTLARNGAALGADLEAADLRAHRRGGSRAHDQPARGHWRRAQLGLPLHLAA